MRRQEQFNYNKQEKGRIAPQRLQNVEDLTLQSDDDKRWSYERKKQKWSKQKVRAFLPGWENTWQGFTYASDYCAIRRKKEIDRTLDSIMKSGIVFLDVGCTEGMYVQKVARMQVFSVGMDLYKPFITRAKEKQKEHDVFCDFVIGDAQNLPFKTDSIGAVLCSEVLEHTEHYPTVMAELARICCGAIVVSVPLELNLLSQLGRIVTRKKLIPSARRRTHALNLPIYGHRNIFTKRSLLRDFRQVKMKDITTINAMSLRFLGMAWIPLRTNIVRRICDILRIFDVLPLSENFAATLIVLFKKHRARS